MPSPLRICAVTGSRADYGLLRRTLRAIATDPDLELQLVVTGAHLDPRSGPSRDEILADGLPISAEVDMLLADDGPAAVTKSLGLALIGFADTLARLRPHLMLLLGDRYEILAPAQAALLARIPVAHVHGGEISEGAMDESIRHALTKLAHIHLVSAAVHARRVIQLGEAPERVWVVGAPGLDAVADTDFMDRAELEGDLGRPLGGPHLLVTYHPVTLEDTAPEAALAPLLTALDALPEFAVTFTGSNADPAGRRFERIIEAYVTGHEQARFVPHLGQRRYLSLARLSTAVVGNSSSGLIEIPALGTPTVNIGERQRGRLRAPSVIDCPAEAAAIQAAIGQARSPEFQALAGRGETPYGTPGVAARIHRILKDVELDGILRKPFRDCPGC